MAAAIVPLVISAVGLITPLIPGVITFVENLFGKGTGPQKMSTAVDLLTKVLQDIANLGKIPSAGVVDPSLPAALQIEVQKIFDQMNGQSVSPSVVPVGAGGNVSVSTQTVTLMIGKVIVTFPVSG
jgi:hypothetical protein